MARAGSPGRSGASDRGRWPPTGRAATTVVVAALVVASLMPAIPAAGQASPDAIQASEASQGSSDEWGESDAILVIEDADTGRTLLGVPVENGTNVSLVYNHSVEKTRVIDTYEVRGDRLVMTRMEFSSFGAGLPSRADVNRTANGTYAFDPPGAYEELFVKPGRIADHRLRVGDRSFDLVALSNASTVRIHLAGCAAGPATPSGATNASAEGQA